MAIVELGGSRGISCGQTVEQTSIPGVGSRPIDTRPRQRGQQPHPERAYVIDVNTDWGGWITAGPKAGPAIRLSLLSIAAERYGDARADREWQRREAERCLVFLV